MMRKSLAARQKYESGFSELTRFAVAAVAVVLIVAILGGCGLETDQANDAMAKAAKSQDEAEAILARVKNFPAEWEVIFNTPRLGPDQITRARQLIKSRNQDLSALEKALEKWSNDISPIKKLNVEEKIKEYAKLKFNAVNSFSEYTTSYLRPALKAYSNLLDLIASGRPLTELNKSAEEITALAAEATAKLQECESANKQADDYFQENRLGR